jgi:ribosomal protein S18 acetylase RimI-like enzyme
MTTITSANVERLAPKDVARASALFKAILDEDWLPEGVPGEDHIRRALADNTSVFVVASVEEDGKAVDVGFAMAFRLLSPLKPHAEAYLDDVFVAETHRGRGIGKALVEAVKSHMSAAYVPVLWIATDADNEEMTGLMDNQEGSERTDDVVHYALELPVVTKTPNQGKRP